VVIVQVNMTPACIAVACCQARLAVETMPRSESQDLYRRSEQLVRDVAAHAQGPRLRPRKSSVPFPEAQARRCSVRLSRNSASRASKSRSCFSVRRVTDRPNVFDHQPPAPQRRSAAAWACWLVLILHDPTNKTKTSGSSLSPGRLSCAIDLPTRTGAAHQAEQAPRTCPPRANKHRARTGSASRTAHQ